MNLRSRFVRSNSDISNEDQRESTSKTAAIHCYIQYITFSESDRHLVKETFTLTMLNEVFTGNLLFGIKQKILTGTTVIIMCMHYNNNMFFFEGGLH